MRSMKALIFAIAFLLLVSAVPAQGSERQALTPKEAMATITAEDLKKTLQYLASDKMKGRDTGSQELREAGAWIVERLSRTALQPLFDTSWTQGEPATDMTRTKVQWDAMSVSDKPIRGKFLTGGPCNFDVSSAYVVCWKGSWARNDRERTAFVNGKVVVILPDGDSLDDRQLMILDRRRQQLAEEGAKAVVIPEIGEVGKIKPSGGIPMILLPKRLESFFPKETGPLGDLCLYVQAVATAPVSHNVDAILKGSDPDLSKEIVVFSAHLDHIGIAARAVLGDDINNGADDNASGSAAILAIAEAMSRVQPAPKRSVIFLWFYGEERGMLGSRYYVKNPGRPLAHHRAVFNIEMVGRPDDIGKEEAWVTGWNVSDFGAILEETGKPAGIRFYEHPQRSAMLFGASDNISFATAGIPAHSISAGSLHKDYHKVTDQVEHIQFGNMARVTQGLFLAGWTMADGGKLPTFAEGSRYAAAAANLQRK